MNPFEKQLAEDGKRIAKNITHPEGLAENVSRQLSLHSPGKQNMPVFFALAASVLVVIGSAIWLAGQMPITTPDTITVDLQPLAQPEGPLRDELDLLEQDIESFRQEVTEELNFLL